MLTRALQAGESEAGLSLAEMLVHQERRGEAMALLKQMADENHAEAAYRFALASCGLADQAVQYFAVAAHQGHGEAAYRLAHLATNSDEKIAALRIAAKAHHRLALVSPLPED